MEEELQAYAVENHVPIIKDEGLQFILDYIEVHNVKNILEVGTAVAYSAISMARIDSEIRIDTLERDENLYKLALKNIRNAGLDKQINPIYEDAIEFQANKQYDLIFIDGAKSQYGKHMLHFQNNLKLHGAYIFDNLNFYGLVDANYPAKTRNVRALVRKLKVFREEMLSNPGYKVSFHPEIGDGILLAVKLV